jgi:hypothetical protein
MTIGSNETEIAGEWIVVGGRIAADETTKRIEALVREHLEPVAVAGGGWEKLFRDPTDGRYWEQTFPRSEMHGGGPPKLAALSEQEARAKYEF